VVGRLSDPGEITEPMAERHLTFAEVQEILGLSPDGVRELMESKALHGEIIDGVIQFPEAQVMRLRGTRGEAPVSGDEDMGLVFLVDEEEEQEIEGKAYDGEELLTRKEAIAPAPGEELMEPVELSEDQLRNAELLGTDEAVAFGREVSERTREEEFGTPQLAEDEEIIEPTEVELPEPEFGPLAAAVPEARREEPAEAAPAPEEVEPEAAAAAPEEAEAAEGVVPVEEEAPLEPLVTQAAAPEAPTAPEEAESVAFDLTAEVQPERAGVTEEGWTFLEEETGPMVCPVSEDAEVPTEAPAEPTVVEPLAPAASGLTFEETEAEPVEEPAEAEAEEVTAGSEVEGLQFEEEAPEEVEVPSAAEEAAETFDVTTPEPETVVTEELELAVDEELADLEPERVEEAVVEPEPVEQAVPQPEPVEESAPELAEEVVPEPVSAAEEPSEPEPVFEEPVAEEVPPEPAPVEEAAVEPETVVEPAAAADVWEELQEELSAEEGAPHEEAAPVTAESDRGDTASDLERPPQVEADEIPEEVEQVSEEPREEEEAFEPEEELIPLEEETGETPAAEEPVPVEPEPADTFDLAEPGEPVPLEEIEVTDLEDVTPGAAHAEEDLVVLEEETPAVEPGTAKTLEEEVAELFEEETVPASPDEAFAAAPAAAAEEDFDLSVFQQEEAAAEEALPTTDESLFEEVGEQAPVEEAHPVEAVEPVEGVSRIRALTEERAAPSTAAITAAILLAFAAVAFTGMLLWHLFNTG